ncbi:MAG: hypothetical protein PUK18_01125 [Firmicutes bacterium]|nr:hypothetical protein [Bacillota bacterium]MDY6159797.1 hypothetical protein [Candidatus Faecousia sp.]
MIKQEAMQPVIGQEQIRRAQVILNRYKEGKANLERRVVDNEQWYKLRHWECMRGHGKNQVEPTSGWLFNAIASKHADVMDNYPSPNVLPREEGDRGEAKLLGSILPVVLEQSEFEQVYDEVNDYKLKAGTGIYGVFWDPNGSGGLGDVAIKKVDILNLFWESGITDIQQSANVFHIQLVSNQVLQEQYPQLAHKFAGPPSEPVGSKYLYDDRVDTTDKSAVVDWYYKKQQGGRSILHYCKYVGDQVLFATENEPEYAQRGWYDHGLYPFVFDPLFRMAGTPCGFGYIDVAKSAQEYIDRGNQAILMNLLVNARPRHFIRSDGSVNEEEYGDLTRDFVHVEGGLGQDSILPIQSTGLSEVYLAVLNSKVDELKEVTGNRDISTGGTSSGVTAASAIAAMQEAGSKLSRDSNKAAYRAFRKLCLMVIELIRQFYTLPRCFRIMGEQGAAEFVQYSNAGLLPRDQGSQMGIPLGSRVPLFDITVSAQKQSAYSRMSQNEMALQFYSAGFFDPRNAQQALLCMDMMDFDRKEMVMQQIAKNAQQYQLTLSMLELEQPQRPEAEAPARKYTSPKAPKEKQEHYAARSARQRVAESTKPV